MKETKKTIHIQQIMEDETKTNNFGCLCNQEDYNKQTSHLVHLISINKLLYWGYNIKKTQQQSKSELMTSSQQQKSQKKKFTFKIGGSKQKIQTQIQKYIFFDLSQKTWQKSSIQGKIPLPRQSCQSLLLNSQHLLMYGGKNLQNNKLFNDLHVFSITSNTWKKLFSIQCPTVSQNNLLVKLTDTKALLINKSQIWTFETKSVNWELSTNELPGGVWQNHNISLADNLLTQQQLIYGISVANMSQSILLISLQKSSKQFTIHLNNLSPSQKLLTKLNPSQQISFISQKSQIKQFIKDLIIFKIQESNIIFIVVGYVEQKTIRFILVEINIKKDQARVVDRIEVKPKHHIINFKFTYHTHNRIIYILSDDKQQKGLKQLIKLQLKLNIINQPVLTYIRPLPTSLMKTSDIHSIAEQSNQSSVVGGIRSNNINDTQNYNYDLQEEFDQFFDGPEKMHHSFQDDQQNQRVNHNVLRQSERKGAKQYEVNTSPINYINDKVDYFQTDSPHSSHRKKINEYTQSQQQYKCQSQNPSQVFTKKQLANYKSQRIQQAQQAVFQGQMHQTLQKLLLLEHKKRYCLEQKSILLQKSIRKSEKLAKYLTGLATSNQKQQHINEIQQLKRQLEGIWSRESFYKQELEKCQAYKTGFNHIQ